MKMQPTECEKIFANYIMDKGLISKKHSLFLKWESAESFQTFIKGRIDQIQLKLYCWAERK